MTSAGSFGAWLAQFCNLLSVAVNAVLCIQKDTERKVYENIIFFFRFFLPLSFSISLIPSLHSFSIYFYQSTHLFFIYLSIYRPIPPPVYSSTHFAQLFSPHISCCLIFPKLISRCLTHLAGFLSSFEENIQPTKNMYSFICSTLTIFLVGGR